MKLSLCLDLGADTLKVSFAYISGKEVVFRKISVGDEYENTPIPARALYDRKTNSWLYGDNINNIENVDLTKIVTIKSLMMLLNKTQGIDASNEQQIHASNMHYYFSEHHFPKFYFPVRRFFDRDFGKMVSQEMTFLDPRRTPHDVVLEFFQYVEKTVTSSLEKYKKINHISFDKPYTISIVTPLLATRELKEEMTKVIATVFNHPQEKITLIPSPKAIGLFAFHQKKIKSGNKVLLFDMGESSITVVKTGVVNEEKYRGITVDGIEGHSLPINIGGTNIDEEIADYLEKQIANRAAIDIAQDENEQIHETALYSNQYLLLQSIKQAKMILSSNDEGFDFIFRDGVPINIHREVLIQKNITKNEIVNVIGITNDTGYAKHIYNYIQSELSLPASKDTTHILLSGGLIETHGLFNYLKKKLEANNKVSVIEIDTIPPTNDVYALTDYDNSTYSAAVGGAIALICNYSFDTVLTMSYGTWVRDRGKRGVKVFSFFVEKNTPIDTTPFIRGQVFGASSEAIKEEEIFSTPFAIADLRNNHATAALLDAYGDLVVGDRGDDNRKKAEQYAYLNVVSGGKNGIVYFMYNGKRVKLHDKVNVFEGVSIDENGIATPLLYNVKDSNQHRVRVSEITEGNNQIFVTQQKVQSVYAYEIELVFKNLDGFKTKIG